MWPHELLLDPIWQRLATALIHFAWQGALVAAIYAIAAEWLSHRAELRYSLGVMALVVMAACPVMTFVAASPPAIYAIGVADEFRHDATQPRGLDVASPASVAALANDSSSRSSAAIDALINQATGIDSSGLTTAGAATARDSDQNLHMASYLPPAWQNQARLALALVWLAGVFVGSARLVIGAIGLRRITACTMQAGEEHLRLLARLARAMSVRRSPRLVVSQRVRQAIATGFFQPIIVMPAAWLAELPPSVIEAVLAHELAHIRRCDLWVNLLQRAVEALLFFHPAVWWLSRQIRSERELCCDKLAVAATRRRVEYVSALEVVARRAACERSFSLATGIGGRKMQLLERVRHVLGLPATPRGRAWWPAGILALAVPCMLWVLSGPARPALADDDDKVESRERDREDADRDDDEEEREVRKVEVGEDEFEVEIELRGDDLVRDKRASDERVEAARREKLRDQEIRVDQARREIEKARADLERRVGEAREQIVEAVRRAEQEGNKEQVDALHRKMEAVRREAEAQMRALEAKFRAVSEELGRGVEKQRPVSEEAMQHARAMAEKVEHQMRERRRELGEQLRAAEKVGDKAAIEKLRAAAEAMNAEAAVIRQKIERQASDIAEKQRAVAEARVREARAMVEKVERDLSERRRAIEEKMEIARKEGDKVAIEKLHAAMKMMETEAAAVREKVKRSAGEIGKVQFPDKVKIDKSQLPGKVTLDFTDKKIDFTEKQSTKPRSPEADRELLDMVRQLREEVQELRREVRELRGERRPTLEFREERGDKEPQTSVLREIPYVGRLFPKGKREEVEVELDFSDERKADLHKVQTELDNIKKLGDDEAVKLKAIELEVQLKDSDLKKLKNVQIELKDRDLEKLKAIELKNRDLEKLNLIELKNREVERAKLMDVKNELELKNRELQNELRQIESLREKAGGDVDREVRYAQKAAEIAKKEWDKAVEANRKTPGAITEIDLDRLKLAHELKLLETERAKNAFGSELQKILDARKDIQNKIDKLNETARETAKKLYGDGGNKPNLPAPPNKENSENPKP